MGNYKFESKTLANNLKEQKKTLVRKYADTYHMQMLQSWRYL